MTSILIVARNVKVPPAAWKNCWCSHCFIKTSTATY